jgi:gliding motility-associated lipoprotein GldH
MISRLITAIVVTLVVVGCTGNDVYFEYKPISEAGWNKDSICRFDVSISDTLAHYNVYVNVRHRKDYPYQNLWIFLKMTAPSKCVTKDSIECYLADAQGKWLSTGIGSILNMPVLYRQNVTFQRAGVYRFELLQGMREDVLTGINDMGIRVEKCVDEK